MPSHATHPNAQNTNIKYSMGNYRHVVYTNTAIGLTHENTTQLLVHGDNQSFHIAN